MRTSHLETSKGTRRSALVPSLRSWLAATVVALSVMGLNVQAQTTKPTAPPQVLLPGLWEITVQTRTPIAGPPITHSTCVTKVESVLPVPPKAKKLDDCQVVPNAAAANEMAYTVRCAKRKVTSAARFTYSGDHFTGTVTIQTDAGEIQQVYSGVRIGDCEDPPEPSPIPPGL
jgi:hypothetical protein